MNQPVESSNPNTHGGRRVALCAALACAALLVAGMWSAPPAALAAPQAASGAVRLATVDILDVSEALLSSDRYKPSRDALSDRLNVKIKALADELENLRQRIVSLPQGDPVAQALYGEYQSKNQAFQQAQQDAYQEAEKLNVGQLAEAYRLAAVTVNSMAAAKGYTHVITTKSGPVSLKTDNVPAALQEILSRPLLVMPAADDLTEAVLAELKVTRAPEEEPAAPPAQTQPTGTPGVLKD